MTTDDEILKEVLKREYGSYEQKYWKDDKKSFLIVPSKGKYKDVVLDLTSNVKLIKEAIALTREDCYEKTTDMMALAHKRGQKAERERILNYLDCDWKSYLKETRKVVKDIKAKINEVEKLK